MQNNFQARDCYLVILYVLSLQAPVWIQDSRVTMCQVNCVLHECLMF